MLKLHIFVEIATLRFFSNVNTLQCILTVVGAKVSFDVPNSLPSVFGFKRDIVYGVGRHASEKRVNIMNVNSIRVHCNIIHSWCMRGQQAPVVYIFFPNPAPGQKILEAPTQFNLPPSDCRRHFNFVSVVDGPRRRALGFTWREIDYTFSYS